MRHGPATRTDRRRWPAGATGTGAGQPPRARWAWLAPFQCRAPSTRGPPQLVEVGTLGRLGRIFRKYQAQAPTSQRACCFVVCAPTAVAPRISHLTLPSLAKQNHLPTDSRANQMLCNSFVQVQPPAASSSVESNQLSAQLSRLSATGEMRLTYR